MKRLTIIEMQEIVIDGYKQAENYGDNRFGRQRRCRKAALRRAREAFTKQGFNEEMTDYLIRQAIDIANAEIGLIRASLENLP